jgi:hypothetical protein
MAYLGDVYTYEFAYDSAYDSVYDLVPKVDCNRIWDRFFLKRVYKRLELVYDRELKPYALWQQIVHEIVRRFVHGIVHV